MLTGKDVTDIADSEYESDDEIPEKETQKGKEIIYCTQNNFVPSGAASWCVVRSRGNMDSSEGFCWYGQGAL
jgi:hypothetical protein